MTLRRLALLPLLVALALLVPAAVRQARSNVRGGLAGLRDDTLTARRKVFGPYADAIEAIRRTIPKDAEYLLVVEDAPGAPDFVSYDLAPRRPRFLPGIETVADLRKAGPPKDSPEWVVVAVRLTDPPRAVPARDFFAASAP